MKTSNFIIYAFFFMVFENIYSQTPEWMWVKGFSGKNDNFCYSLAIDTAGNGDIYTTGWFSGSSDFDPGPGTFVLTSGEFPDIFISKLDPSGNFVWVKSLSGPLNKQGWSMALDPSGLGDVYITGSFQGTVDFDPGDKKYLLTSQGDADIFVCKLDSEGNFMWAKAVGGKGSDVSRSIAIDPNGSGDVYITGSFSGKVDFDPGAGVFKLNAKGYVDIFISKLDSGGNFIWAKAIGGSSYDQGYSIALDPAGSGDVYVTGAFTGRVDFDPSMAIYLLTTYGYTGIFVSKYDAHGNLLWAKAMGGLNSDSEGHSIALDPRGKGAVYTTGSFSGTVDFDPGEGMYYLSGNGTFISKLDYDGHFEWANVLNGFVYTGTDRSLTVDLSGKGAIYSTGTFENTMDFDPGNGEFYLTPDGQADIFISKMNRGGEFEWAIPVNASRYDAATSLALDNLGNLCVAGFFDSPKISFGSTTLENPESILVIGEGHEVVFYSFDIFIAKLEIRPLPVELISFNAAYDNELVGVNLNWITAEEINNDYFTIERSGDLINFQPIFSINGAGNSENLLQYEAFDPNPGLGKNYYRLRQTDLDGKSSISHIVGVSTTSKSYSIYVYPNPVTNALTIDLNESNPHQVEITMYDNSGRIVFAEKVKNFVQTRTIDTGTLAPAIYFVQLNIDGNNMVKKVVKE